MRVNLKRFVVSMLAVIGFTAAAFFLPPPATAVPVTLKLFYVSSDRDSAYLSLVKPFVDAVNGDPRGLLKINVSFSAQAGAPNQQAQYVANGKADIAFVIAGIEPKLFPDQAAVELPGLFRDTREASLVYMRLVAANELRGYNDFFVIGAVATQPETINSRKRTASLADLKGQTLRVNNPTVAGALTKFGASAKIMALNETANAIASGTVDGAVLQLAQVFSFGIGRLTPNHYLLPLGSAPLLLVMNRKVFDGLPEPARKVIRDHSGVWLVGQYTKISDAFSRRVLDQLKADSRRNVVEPSAQDRAAAQSVFDTMAEEWAAASPRNRELLTLVKSELAKIRSSKESRP